MWGLTEEEAAEGNKLPTFEVWPDNLESVNVFVAMATQWIVGAGGTVGLIYGHIEPTLRLLGVPRKDWQRIFGELRTLEDAALEQIRANKDNG